MALMIHQQAREQLQAAEETAGAWNPPALRAELERLLQIYPDFAPALARLGALSEEAGDLPSALRHRQRAVTAEPGDANLWVELASLQHRRLRQTRPALLSLKQALQLDAGHPAAAALLAEMEQAAPALPA
jgi:tetratricopeptide (TPR) repeat protein